MMKRLKILAPLPVLLAVSSCVCQVQTSEAIRLHGQECEGVILKGCGSGNAELYHVGNTVYVKGIQTRLERVDCELAYYQCPSYRNAYAPVPGAPQQEVYVRLNSNETPRHTELTLPAGAMRGGTPITPFHYYDYCASDTGKNTSPDPVVALTPMQNNDRAWYTAPLSVIAFTLVDIPGTVLGSVGGALYTLCSPDESFSMEYDDWGFLAM